MKTDFDFRTTESNAPTIFRDDFNAHKQTLNPTQAWSLFFTGGKADNSLGFNPVLGLVFTSLAVGLAVVSIVSSGTV